MNNSLITTGNNYRIKKVIDKARKGENVTIAYIGGSVTEGAGASTHDKSYTYQSYLYFKDRYGKNGGDNIKYVNAGMGGTPSALGVIRYDRDVTSYGKIEPDIVLIEFSVNDYQEPTKGVAYESLIRNILKAPNQPAVILLFAVFKTRWNLQDNYIPTGNHYNLPMISVKDALVPELEEGRITDEEFFFDEYHPTDFGHGFMTDCIKYYFNAVDTEAISERDIIISDIPKVGNAFEGVKMVDSKTADSNVAIITGSFTEEDCHLVSPFPNNWMHIKDKGNDSFKITLKCKNILLVTKSTSDSSYGIADILVDGGFIKSIDSSVGGGWNNAITTVILDEDTSSEHTIEIKMTQGDEDKSFTILAIGYTL